MTKLMVFNREEEYVGDIKSIISAKQTIILNGEDSLEISTLDNNIEKDFRILFHDTDSNELFEYIVSEKSEYKDGNIIVTDIYAENSIAETIGDFIEDKRSINQLASHAISRALESTRWTLDQYEDNGYGTVTFYRTNARAAIDEIISEWLLEMKTNISWNRETNKIDRYISFVRQRGEQRGTRLTYTRDIVDIRRKNLPGNIVTALYGFGKSEETSNGGFSRKLDFSSINGGKSYVENNVAKELWGRVDNNGNKIHTFGQVEFSNISDKARLLERTKGELERLSKPSVSYESKIYDIFRLNESTEKTKDDHDYIEIGDTVLILDKDFVPAINFNIRVLKMEKDLINKENTNITLGELIRDTSDRDAEQDKELEDLKDAVEDIDYDNWEDGENPGGGWDDDTTYYNPTQLVEANPSLKIGRSYWVDISTPTSVEHSVKGKVLNARDLFTNEVIFAQNDVERRPGLVNIDERRWLSFEPDPRTLLRWKYDEERPVDAIQQHGQYLNNMKVSETVRTIYVVYRDRTPDILETEFSPGAPAVASQIGRLRRRASNAFTVGYSSPLGFPYSEAIFPMAASSGIDRDGLDTPFFSSTRVREETVLGKVTMDSKIGELDSAPHFFSLGMNKFRYDDYRSARDVSVSYYSNSWTPYVYEVNAFFTGEIGEIIAYNRELDAKEHELIIDYLSDKYSFSSILT